MALNIENIQRKPNKSRRSTVNDSSRLTKAKKISHKLQCQKSVATTNNSQTSNDNKGTLCVTLCLQV